MKKQNVSQQITYWLNVVSLGLILGLGLQFAQGWTAPPENAIPPTGNVSGPVTVGGGAQYKTGFLGIGTSLTPIVPLEIAGNAIISGKVYSSSTQNTDDGTTLATKDYVDSKVGVGSIVKVRTATLTGGVVRYICISSPGATGYSRDGEELCPRGSSIMYGDKQSPVREVPVQP